MPAKKSAPSKKTPAKQKLQKKPPQEEEEVSEEQWEDCPDEEAEEEEAIDNPNAEAIFSKAIFARIAKGSDCPQLVAHHSYYAWLLFIDIFTTPELDQILYLITDRLNVTLVAEIQSHLALLLRKKLSAKSMVHDYLFRRTHLLIRIFVEVLMVLPRDDANYSNHRLDCLDGLFWIVTILEAKKHLFSRDAIIGSLMLLQSVFESGMWKQAVDWTIAVQTFAESSEENLVAVQKEAKHVLEVTPRLLGVLLSESIGKKYSEGQKLLSPDCLDHILNLSTTLMGKIEGTTAGDNGRDYDEFFWSDFFLFGGSLENCTPMTIKRDVLPFYLSRVEIVSSLAETVAARSAKEIDAKYVPIIMKMSTTKADELTAKDKSSFLAFVRGFHPPSASGALEPPAFFFLPPPAPAKKGPTAQPRIFCENAGVENIMEENKRFFSACTFLSSCTFDMFRALPDDTIDLVYKKFSPSLLDTLLTKFTRASPRIFAALVYILSVPFKKNGGATYDTVLPHLENIFDYKTLRTTHDASGDVHILKGVARAIPLMSAQEENDYMRNYVKKSQEQQKVFATTTERLDQEQQFASPKLNELSPQLLEFFLKLVGKAMKQRPNFVQKSIFDGEEEDGAEEESDGDDNADDDEASIDMAEGATDSELDWVKTFDSSLELASHYLLGPLATPVSRNFCVAYIMIPVTNWLAGFKCPRILERRLMFIFCDFVKIADLNDPTTRGFVFPTVTTLTKMITEQSAFTKKLIDERLLPAVDVKTGKTKNMLQKQTVLLSAERPEIDHYLWLSNQSIYCAGIWFRKIDEEMFEGSEKLKKEKDATLRENAQCLRECIVACIEQGFALSNLYQKAVEDYDEKVSKTYFTTPGLVKLPHLPDSRILVVHCHCRILQNMKPLFDQLADEKKNKEFTTEFVLTTILDTISRYYSTGGAALVAASSPQNAVLIAPAAERAIGIIYELQKEIFVSGTLNGPKAPVQPFDKTTNFGTAVATFLTTCAGVDPKVWQRSFVPQVLQELMALAKITKRNDEDENDEGGNDDADDGAAAATKKPDHRSRKQKAKARQLQFPAPQEQPGCKQQ